MLSRDEFDSYWETDGDCWRWLGAMSPNGYGRLNRTYAHQIAYELHVGEIPEGDQIDHLCRNRWCVNPAHLEAVSQRTNLRRGDGFPGTRARQTHCIHGHPLTGDNLWVRKNGTRQCRTCRREAVRRHRAAL